MQVQLRNYQAEVVRRVLSGIDRGLTKFAINSPTGSGKTIMGLAVAREVGGNVIVAVRTHNEMTRFYEDAKKLGLRHVVIGMRSKVHLCEDCLDGCDLEPEDIKCDTCKYYREVKKVLNAMGGDDDLDADVSSIFVAKVIDEKAIVFLRHPPDVDAKTLWNELNGCPYQWSRVVARYEWGRGNTLLIVTYPYLFIPFIRHAIDFGKPNLVIIDEAHNLDNVNTLLERVLNAKTVDNVIKNLSDVYQRNPLTSTYVQDLIHAIDEFYGDVDKVIKGVSTSGELKHVNMPKLKAALAKFNERITEISKRYGFSNVLDKAIQDAEELRMLGRRKKNYVRSFMNTLIMLQAAVTSSNTEWGRLGVYSDGGSLVIKPISVRPFITDFLRWVGDTPIILMSGTMPSKSYMRLAWGLNIDDYIDLSTTVRFGTKVINIDTDVTTEYRQRGEKMYARYAEKIKSIITGSVGGRVFLVVYPSYSVMRNILQHIGDLGVRQVISGVEKSITNLASQARSSDRLVIHAVARDRFTEGVELVDNGRSMITHIIFVGIPYPDISDDYVKDRIADSGMGRYEYLLEHAKIAIRQALGRGVRGPSDTATVYFLDHRFKYNRDWRIFMKTIR